MSIYKLTLAWISSENSTTHEEYWLILTRLPSLLWTSSHPTALSAVRCRLPCPSSVANCLLRVPFSNFLLAFPYPLPVTPRSRVQNPFSGFAPKQTKESSAWRTSYLVLHRKAPSFGWSTFGWASCVIVKQGFSRGSCPTLPSHKPHYNRPSGH